MTHADFEALDARRQAPRDRGEDSDESTVANNDDDEDSGFTVQVGQDNLDLKEEMNEEAIEDTIEASICHSMTSMFKRVLMFSQGAADSLYNDQMIMTSETLRELDDDTIRETCKAIKKPGEGTLGYQISEISVTRFKLFAFWVRHMWRTCRSIDDWTGIS